LNLTRGACRYHVTQNNCIAAPQISFASITIKRNALGQTNNLANGIGQQRRWNNGSEK
jgi:hypothetical protein